MSRVAASLRRRRRLAPGINLTSMLDVVMNVMFFFLVATQIKKDEAALDVKLPDSESATVSHQRNVPSVTINAAGRIFFRDREMSEEDLQTEMTQLARQGTGEVDIRGDRGVEFGAVVHLMDICKRAGLKAANWVAVGGEKSGADGK